MKFSFKLPLAKTDGPAYVSENWLVCQFFAVRLSHLTTPTRDSTMELLGLAGVPFQPTTDSAVQEYVAKRYAQAEVDPETLEVEFFISFRDTGWSYRGWSIFRAGDGTIACLDSRFLFSAGEFKAPPADTQIQQVTWPLYNQRRELYVFPRRVDFEDYPFAGMPQSHQEPRLGAGA